MKVNTYFRKVHVITILCCLLCVMCLSCSHPKDNTFGEYKSQTINVDLEKKSKPLNMSQYDIDSVVSISLPDSAKHFLPTKLIVKNNRIYILDSQISKTIYVFDNNGNYMFKLGERGRAQDEYIGGPTDFFVDDENRTYVFDRMAQQIKKFKGNGQFSENIWTADLFIHSFGLLNNKHFVYCKSSSSREEDVYNSALILSDLKSVNRKQLLRFKQNYSLLPSEQTFFSNDDRLSHIPILSDSVLVFKKDSLEKIIRFDFGGKFIQKERPDIAIEQNNLKDLNEYDGVTALEVYQETESLAYLRYIYNSTIREWLYNKNTKQTISGYYLFDCFLLNSRLKYLRGNQIVTIIDQERIDFLRDSYRDSDLPELLKQMPPQVKRIFDGNIPVPAVVYISLK